MHILNVVVVFDLGNKIQNFCRSLFVLNRNSTRGDSGDFGITRFEISSRDDLTNFSERCRTGQDLKMTFFCFDIVGARFDRQFEKFEIMQKGLDVRTTEVEDKEKILKKVKADLEKETGELDQSKEEWDAKLVDLIARERKCADIEVSQQKKQMDMMKMKAGILKERQRLKDLDRNLQQFGEDCDTGGDDASVCEYGQEECIGCNEQCQWAMRNGNAILV